MLVREIDVLWEPTVGQRFELQTSSSRCGGDGGADPWHERQCGVVVGSGAVSRGDGRGESEQSGERA
jgi:hypothetical protein